VRDLVSTELTDAIDNLDVQVPRFYSWTGKITATCIRDWNNMPMLLPKNFFMPKTTTTNSGWNEWPGNMQTMELCIGEDDLVNAGLATGMGNFLIRTLSSDIMIAGMIGAYIGKYSAQGKTFERFHIEKWTASGAKWNEHDQYYISLSGTHWEKRA